MMYHCIFSYHKRITYDNDNMRNSYFPGLRYAQFFGHFQPQHAYKLYAYKKRCRSVQKTFVMLDARDLLYNNCLKIRVDNFSKKRNRPWILLHRLSMPLLQVFIIFSATLHLNWIGHLDLHVLHEKSLNTRILKTSLLFLSPGNIPRSSSGVLLLILNIFQTFFKCFYCWLWTSKR